MTKNAFGQFCKDARIRSGQTLRKFCLKNGFEANVISCLERGLLSPPRSKVMLGRYAAALQIEIPWRDFCDLADAGRSLTYPPEPVGLEP